MKLITQTQLIVRAAQRWKDQYTMVGGEWRYGPDKSATHAKLEALGPNASVEEVNAAIGNTSWTMITCHECGQDCTDVVQIGQEPDYESSTANVCVACIEKALRLFREPI